MKRFLPTLAVLTCAATTVSAAPRVPSAQKAPAVAPMAQQVVQQAVQQGVQPVAPPVAASTERPSRRDMVRRILGHSVRFMVYDGPTARRTASGVAIATETNPDGAFSYVLTNAHAVDTRGLSEPRFSVLVEDRGDVSEFFARPVAVGSVPDMDLALVKVRGVSLPAVALAEDSELELGDDVVVAAAPYGKALSISGGMISQVEWDRETRRPLMLKTDAPIGYGASGGGIYSLATGKLVAIVEGYRTAKIGFEVGDQPYSFDVPMPGETFASPSGKVRGFLEAKGFGHILQPVQAAAGPVSAAAR